MDPFVDLGAASFWAGLASIIAEAVPRASGLASFDGGRSGGVGEEGNGDGGGGDGGDEYEHEHHQG